MPITKQALEHLDELKLRPERLEMLEQLLQRFIDEDKRQAIVFKATKKGIPIFEGVYGNNTKEYGLKLDTMFSVCSVTKPVFATLLMCMQEDGLIDLTEPVYKYLPEFTGGGREKICLWQFMTHTSGLMENETYDDFNNYIENELEMGKLNENCTEEERKAYYDEAAKKMGIAPNAKGREKDLFYQISLKTPIRHEPRSHMTYNNYGYNRLKDIVDEVLDESIDSYASKRLFHPLGMYDTIWKVPEDKWYKIIGRRDDALASKWFNSESNWVLEGASNGLKTTVNDMVRLCEMVNNGGILNGVRVLSKASVRQMRINYNKGVSRGGFEEYVGWSLGWNYHGRKTDDAGMLRSESCIEHGGFGGTKILADPEEELALASFSVEILEPTEPDFYSMQGRAINLLYSAFE